MKETLKYLFKEAKAKKNREKTNITWYIGEGTSGGKYLYTFKDNITCFIYIGKNGKYSRPTFVLVTKKYPYGTAEVNYKEALQLLQFEFDI